MPVHDWSLTFDTLATYTNAWQNGQAGSLLIWAVWAADGLYYLLDLDEVAFGGAERQLGEHPVEGVELAHVRWAAGTAITVLDLCAACLGRLYCEPLRDEKEYSLRYFVDQDALPFRALPQPAREWVLGVLTDEDYRTALRARNPMTHSRLPRNVYKTLGSAPGPHGDRTGYKVGPGGSEVTSRPLIELCAAVATRHLDAYLSAVERGEITAPPTGTG